MLARLRGTGRTCGSTANERPIGCPGVGYGSCPTMSTRTSSSGAPNALSTRSPLGRYPRPAAVSARRKSPSSAMRGATGASALRPPRVDEPVGGELVEGLRHLRRRSSTRARPARWGGRARRSPGRRPAGRPRRRSAPCARRCASPPLDEARLDRGDEPRERAPLATCTSMATSTRPMPGATVSSSRSSAASSGATATPPIRQPPTSAPSAAIVAPAENAGVRHAGRDLPAQLAEMRFEEVPVARGSGRRPRGCRRRRRTRRARARRRHAPPR